MSLPRLFVLSPGTLAEGDVHAFELAARGLVGLDLAVVLREPNLLDGAYLRLARSLAAQVPLYLHDRAHLVTAAGARGVHVGFRSLLPDDVRRVGDFPVGLSTHACDDPATWSAADYLFHGPLKPTPSKRGRVEAVGFDGLESALRRTDRPLLALGGISPDDVSACRAAGAHGIAVLSGVWGDDWRSSRPAANALAYIDALVAVDA
ncbi:MAG: thiamine phosphate synthase [Planctomycetota bacterium]